MNGHKQQRLSNITKKLKSLSRSCNSDFAVKAAAFSNDSNEQPGNMVPPLHKTRVRTQRWSTRGKKLVTLLLLATTLLSLMMATASAAVTPSPSLALNSTTQSSVGATTHPIEYHIGCPPSMVDDGSLDYFKAHGFTAVHLVVPNSGTYQTELNKIKSLGMKPIIDVEQVIWAGGQLQSTPITSFGPYFQSLKNAGWEVRLLRRRQNRRPCVHGPVFQGVRELQL